MCTGNRVRIRVWPLACQLYIENDINDQKKLHRFLTLSLSLFVWCKIFNSDSPGRSIIIFVFGWIAFIDDFLCMSDINLLFILLVRFACRYRIYVYMYAKKVIWSPCGKNELVVPRFIIHFPFSWLIRSLNELNEALNPPV